MQTGLKFQYAYSAYCFCHAAVSYYSYSPAVRNLYVVVPEVLLRDSSFATTSYGCGTASCEPPTRRCKVLMANFKSAVLIQFSDPYIEGDEFSLVICRLTNKLCKHRTCINNGLYIAPYS